MSYLSGGVELVVYERGMGWKYNFENCNGYLDDI